MFSADNEPILTDLGLVIDMKEEHGSGSEEYQSNFPDFKKWESLFPGMTSSEISRKFLEDTIFDLMPVVAISYEQVAEFLTWRKNKLMKELDKMNPKMRGQFPKDFVFRLPTNKEWARIRFINPDSKMLKQLDKMSAVALKDFKFKKNSTLNKIITALHNNTAFCRCT